MDDGEPLSPLTEPSRLSDSSIITDADKERQELIVLLRFRSRLGLGQNEQVSDRRLCVSTFLYGKSMEMGVALVTLFNFMLILLETDINADGEETPMWLKVPNLMCLAAFGFELGIRVYVEGTRIVRSAWNWLDIVVVLSGVVGALFEALGVDVVSLGFLRVFRCFRLVRLFKAVVLTSHFSELRKIIRGITSCLRALAWSVALILLIMTMWATLAVELLHPLMDKVAKNTEAWEQCPRCARAFSSVFAANLTFFQTVIAGDSWGTIAIPVIEKYPWACFIFGGCLFTLVVGILNLIIAVLVDNAAEARLNDTEARSHQAKAEEVREKALLAKMFELIDTDHSGALSFDELEQGATDVLEFQQKLRVMDIQGEDLRILFSMLDESGSGEIDPGEFINTLYRMKCGDNKTAAVFVKQYVLHMKKNQMEMHKQLVDSKLQLVTLLQAMESLRTPGGRKKSQTGHSANPEISLSRQDSKVSEVLSSLADSFLQQISETPDTFGSEVEDSYQIPLSSRNKQNAVVRPLKSAAQEEPPTEHAVMADVPISTPEQEPPIEQLLASSPCRTDDGLHLQLAGSCMIDELLEQLAHISDQIRNQLTLQPVAPASGLFSQRSASETRGRDVDLAPASKQMLLLPPLPDHHGSANAPGGLLLLPEASTNRTAHNLQALDQALEVQQRQTTPAFGCEDEGRRSI